jgi:hypothetical protein
LSKEVAIGVLGLIALSSGVVKLFAFGMIAAVLLAFVAIILDIK